jgi:hypothetical protein
MAMIVSWWCVAAHLRAFRFAHKRCTAHMSADGHKWASSSGPWAVAQAEDRHTKVMLVLARAGAVCGGRWEAE